MSEMSWWEFVWLVFLQSGLWLLLLAAWLVFCFVLGVVVFIIRSLLEEYEYYKWRKSVEASHTAAKNRADAKKRSKYAVLHKYTT